MQVKYLFPKEVGAVIKKFQKSRFEIYIIGGAVRDILMGRQISNWDFATNTTPSQILKIFPKAFYNNKFGTVGVETPLGIFEITTFRKEGKYADFRHPGKVEWGKTIDQDLARRDFTINAMALRLSSPARSKPILELIDPFAGQKDLGEKIVRAVGDPSKRFSEDALRLIRAVRIATELKFLIEEKTFAAIQANGELIKNISGERIRDELFKILASQFPADGLILLRNSRISEQILPELEKCFGVEQASPGRHHIWDVGTHSFKSLEFCPSKDPLVRFATLIHDIGKPEVAGTGSAGEITFYNHEVVGAGIARKISDRFHLSKKQRVKLVTLVRWHQFTVDEATTAAAARRFIRRVGIKNIADMIDLRMGDRLGGGLKEATSWRLKRFLKLVDQELHPPFSVTDLAIDGRNVMKILEIGPGPAVGEILNQLFEEVLEDRKKNSKEYLLKRLEEIKNQKLAS